MAKSEESMKSRGKGTGVGNYFILKNTLYIPNVCTNLLSVSAIIVTEEKTQKGRSSYQQNNKSIFERDKERKALYTTILNP